ncbi:PREDICTED: protein PHLOEM PROTEIN 2-LIKE A9-like isoform X3 [Populus euphratica]|uniref:Protein PHLOEM PROTEIN 2-LIKE A9-like isoform X3 n=1 Tax=Populus euphratica TaxID=75702 RepID=A0AAJ6SX23_POPEU|nr:PREDICTED: protein PHLOEM PROTEIN 2-LIKE A9-like isoform X3 [Populus euphratica]
MSFLSKSSSQGASKGSKAPPSKHVSKGDEGTGSSFPSISSNMKNLFGRRSKGDGPAELQEVCWLDVTGSMTATKGKAYEISFILSMNEKNSFGWEDPVYVMARIGEKGEYTRVKIDLSKLGLKEEEFPEEKCRVDFRSDENSENNKKTLYFGLYEVWTNHWKGGLRIHEAIVREVTAEDSASTSNTRSDDSKVQEVTADNSTSASESALDKGCFEGQNLFPMPTSRNFQ